MSGVQTEKGNNKPKKTGWHFVCIHSTLHTMFDVSFTAVSLSRRPIFNIYWLVFFVDIKITFSTIWWWFLIFHILAMDIERCAAGDTDCIIRVSNALVQVVGKSEFQLYNFNQFISTLIRTLYYFRFIFPFSPTEGHNGINLIPVDPLHIPSISIKQGAESPVNIELKFTDVDLIGLSNCRFQKLKQVDRTNRSLKIVGKLEWKINIFWNYSGFQANPAGKYYLNVKGPVLYLVGPYKISGRVLVLPIQGEGKSNITLRNEFKRNA